MKQTKLTDSSTSLLYDENSKIYVLNNFEVYISLLESGCHACDIKKVFILPNWNFVPFDPNLPIFSSVLALEPTILLSASMSSSFLFYHIR